MVLEDITSFFNLFKECLEASGSCICSLLARLLLKTPKVQKPSLIFWKIWLYLRSLIALTLCRIPFQSRLHSSTLWLYYNISPVETHELYILLPHYCPDEISKIILDYGGEFTGHVTAGGMPLYIALG